MLFLAGLEGTAAAWHTVNKNMYLVSQWTQSAPTAELDMSSTVAGFHKVKGWQDGVCGKHYKTDFITF